MGTLYYLPNFSVNLKLLKKLSLEKLKKKSQNIFKTVTVSHMWGVMGSWYFGSYTDKYYYTVQQLFSQQSWPNRLACQYGFCFDKTFKFCSGQLPGEWSDLPYQLRVQSPANTKVHLFLETQLLLGWTLVPEIPPSDNSPRGISEASEEAGSQVSPCGQPLQVETWSYPRLPQKASAKNKSH